MISGEVGSTAPMTGVLEELVGRPLSDIAAELSLLREAKTTLSKTAGELSNQVATLEQELTTLRKEKADLSGAVRWLVLQTGFIPAETRCGPIDRSTVAPELLLRIFRAARTPRFQQDPAPGQRADSPWLTELRFRKGLVLVCKGWSGPASEALYEDIVLRRMGQIAGLAHTLLGAADTVAVTNGQRDLAHLVKSVRMDWCIVLPNCMDAIRDALQTIFELCTRLRAFEFYPQDSFPLVTTERDLQEPFNPVWFLQDDAPSRVAHTFRERCSATLRVLDLGFTLTSSLVSSLHELLSSAPCLVTLKLGRVDSNVGKQDLEALPPLLLPMLRELYLHVDNDPFCHHIANRWNLPLLERLTTRDTFVTPQHLLKKHGSRLTYLNLCPAEVNAFGLWHVPTYDATFAETVENCCPLLEHLVFIEDDAKSGRSRLRAEWLLRNLRYLDVWTRLDWTGRHHEFWPRSSLSVWENDLSREVERTSYSVRRLWAFHVDLPIFCSPAKPLNGEDVAVVPTAHALFIQTKSSVFPDYYLGFYKREVLREDGSRVSLASLILDHEPEVVDSGELHPSEFSTPEASVPSDSDIPAASCLTGQEEDKDVEHAVESGSAYQHDEDFELIGKQLDGQAVYERFRDGLQAGIGSHCDTDSDEDG
ncbi:hypothetical protein FKP32DRAFT_1760449 [Trametes sanguinea]|nr:hypothetical protein FKP32DRAFT_1760449 [Trametes sanguinea]